MDLELRSDIVNDEHEPNVWWGKKSEWLREFKALIEAQNRLNTKFMKKIVAFSLGSSRILRPCVDGHSVVKSYK